MIPKKIHQIILVDGMEAPSSIPEQYKHAMDSWKTMNPDHEYTMYTGMDCKRFIKEHYNKRYLRLFNKIRPYAFKCDFVRMLILNKLGGWYADSRQVCLVKLEILESLDREFYASLSSPPNNNNAHVPLSSEFFPDNGNTGSAPAPAHTKETKPTKSKKELSDEQKAEKKKRALERQRKAQEWKKKKEAEEKGMFY